MMRRLLIIALAVFSQSASAGQVNYSSVEYEAGVYSLSFEMDIDAALEKVRALVTDYDNLANLSRMLVESEIISAPGDPVKLRLLVVRACVLFFCRDMRMVEGIEEPEEDVIVTTVIPEQSDFKSGMTRWQLTGLADRKTRIAFSCREEPDFWFPPIIGPLIVKHRLLREAEVIINNIETISADD